MLLKTVFAAIAAMLLVSLAAFLHHKYGKGKVDIEPDGPTAGHARSMLSSLFLLVFAIGVIVPWTTGNAARDNTHTEAQALTEAYWSAGLLPGSAPAQVRAELRDYTSFVVGKEWRVMASGRLSDTGWAKLDALRAQLSAMRFTAKEDQAAQSDVLGQLRAVYQARRQRAADAGAALPSAVLFFTVLTGFLIIGYPYLSGARPQGMALASFLIVTGLLGIGIFMVFYDDHTFAGGLAVKPDAFVGALHEYQRIP